MTQPNPSPGGIHVGLRHRRVAEEERPRILDTYALVYSFILAFLIPGAISIARLRSAPTRSRTSHLDMAFVFGLAATFLTDSRDGFKTVAIRFAVLTPIVLITGTACSLPRRSAWFR